MLATFRAFRPMAVLTAVLLLAGGTMPLVQHACAMMGPARQAGEPPCPQHEHGRTTPHDGAVPPGLHASTQAPHPSTHAMPPTKGCSDCCIIEAAPGIVTSGVRLATLSPETVVAPMAVLHGEVASLRFDRLSSWLFLDAGPPTGTGVALHLLHGILLN